MWVDRFLSEQKKACHEVQTKSKNERRRFERRKVDQSAWLIDPVDRTDHPCVLHDLSIDGTSFELQSNYALPGELLIRLEKEECPIDCRVVWRAKRWVGVRFV